MPDASLHNEKLILEEVAVGNEKAFAKLFKHYKANLFTTALRMTGSLQLAEEILQDSFLKVWLKKEDLPGLHNFAGWLYTVAENLTYNAIKSMQRERVNAREYGEHTVLQEQQLADEMLLHKEYEGLLSKAINRLPPRQLETYQLIKQQGMKREAAAHQMKVSPETVKWNLDQAMRSIRAYCLAHLEDIPPALLLLFIFH